MFRISLSLRLRCCVKESREVHGLGGSILGVDCAREIEDGVAR